MERGNNPVEETMPMGANFFLKAKDSLLMKVGADAISLASVFGAAACSAETSIVASGNPG